MSKSFQSCLTLCDPMDCSLPGSSVHGILQAKIREWGAIPSSKGFPHPGIEPGSPALQADSLRLSHQGSSFQAHPFLKDQIQAPGLGTPSSTCIWSRLPMFAPSSRNLLEGLGQWRVWSSRCCVDKILRKFPLPSTGRVGRASGPASACSGGSVRLPSLCYQLRR